jgi:hypothetical protein
MMKVLHAINATAERRKKRRPLKMGINNISSLKSQKYSSKNLSQKSTCYMPTWGKIPQNKAIKASTKQYFTLEVRSRLPCHDTFAIEILITLPTVAMLDIFLLITLLLCSTYFP